MRVHSSPTWTVVLIPIDLLDDMIIDKQVFPSLDLIGWYTVAARPTAAHIALHDQVSPLKRV